MTVPGRVMWNNCNLESIRKREGYPPGGSRRGASDLPLPIRTDKEVKPRYLLDAIAGIVMSVSRGFRGPSYGASDPIV